MRSSLFLAPKLEADSEDWIRSLSTFAVEMRVMSSILSLVSENTLVLIDELGRG